MANEQEIRDQRQRAILRIVRRSTVRRQQELVTRLGESGFDVTQSSISRDLRELGVVKHGGRYQVPARAESAPGALAEIAHYLRAAKPAGPHLTVVLTRIGAAQTVGIALDRSGWTEIVGTVAGDDTVFVATAGPRDQSRVLHRLHSLLAPPAPERTR